MLVKCFYCGEQIEKTDDACVVEHGYHRYYCHSCRQEALAKQDCLELCDGIFGYHVINMQLEKELKEIAQSFPYSMVRDYLEYNSADISDAIDKQFVSEKNQIQYFAAIIKNNIADFTKSNNDNIRRDIIPEFYESKYTPRKRKRTIAEFEGEIRSELLLQDATNIQKNCCEDEKQSRET